MTDKLCETGSYGHKTGKSWYLYGEDRKPVPDPEVLSLIRASAREAGIAEREFTDEEIVEHSLYGLINEGARIWRRVTRKGGLTSTSFISMAMDSSPGAVEMLRIYDRICEFERETGALEAGSIAATSHCGKQEFPGV